MAGKRIGGLSEVNFNLVIWIAVALLLGLVLGTRLQQPWYKEQLRIEETLRKQLEIEKENVGELRRGMARERELFQEQIQKSQARIDSVERVRIVREARLQAELAKLKKKTVKELQDEGERIYREHADKHQ